MRSLLAESTRRIILIILTWIVIAHSSLLFGQVVTLQETGSSAKRIDVVLVGDGYTSDELDKFASDVNTFLTGFFQEEPFREYRNYFNVRRIDVASLESGVDHPERSPAVFKNTAFDATYNCSGIQRLICVSTGKVFNAIGVLPPSQRDLVLVIVNDSEYGGSGGVVGVASTNSASVEIMLHEVGHTLAFLADEYTSQPPNCIDSVEPTERNATKETTRSLIKWNSWIDPATAVPTSGNALGVPGLYLGSKYCPNTLYRPTFDSKMRSLGRSYDQVNTERFVWRFYDFATPIEAQVPSTTALTLAQGQAQQFSVTTPGPRTHTLTVNWQLNGDAAATGNTFTLQTNSLAVGIHTVTVVVADGTQLVRSDPGSLLTQQVTWTITVSPAPGETIPPTVSFTMPAAGSTVAGSVLVVADAVDNVAVAGVQFKVDDVNLGEEDTTFPYSIVWDTTGVLNGPHELTAVARDSSNNIGTSSIIVTSNNLTSSPVVISEVRSTPGPDGTVTISWKTDLPSDSQVEFGTTKNYGQSTTIDLSLTTAHSVNLSDLSSNSTYHYRVRSRRAPNTLAISGDATLLTYSFIDLGGMSRTTDGLGSLVTGYARLQPGPSNTTPAGVAIFSYRPQGIVVSETGVPDAPLMASGRTYAEVSATGAVNTGLALANPNNVGVRISFDLRNEGGNIVRSGFKDLEPREHFSGFLDQDPFFADRGFRGTFSYTATLPVSVIVLRGLFNERAASEFLMSTLPVIDLSLGTRTGTQVIPHFAAGGGFTTQILLVNSTGSPQTGTIEFLDAGSPTRTGLPLEVNIDGSSKSNTNYLVPANGAAKFVITGALPGLASGSVHVIPSGGGPVPTPLAIFTYKPGAVTASEAIVPVTMGRALRTYVELSSASLINAGIAIANPSAGPGTVTLSLTGLDGSPVVTETTLQLPGSGQIVGFLDQLMPSLVGQSIQGVLRITTDLPSISFVGLRSHYNERSDFLMSTTPVSLENAALGSAERFFPQVANGDGFTTQFILFSGSSGQAANGNVSFFGSAGGAPMSLEVR